MPAARRGSGAGGMPLTAEAVACAGGAWRLPGLLIETREYTDVGLVG